MAMEQQQPLAPEENPFYYTKLRQYDGLPTIGDCGRSDCCVASLDPKRRGKDNVSMPIFFEANDPERPTEKVYFLVDWLYDNRPMKDCIPLIVSKIIQHKITRLYAERNTEECIGMIIEDKLHEQGYYNCVIDEVYSTENKETRIMNSEGDIKSKIMFPRMGLYANSNDIGKALMNVYGYSYTKKVSFDDAPDSLALFAKRFLGINNKRYAKMSSFSRK
jgi:predicted phage terminase large subunit-like protein